MTRNQLLLTAFTLLSVHNIKAEEFPYQSLNYDIYYHCSFIHERAAEATIQISDYDGQYNAILGGCSIPIAGTMYCINDTLQSTFVPSGMSARPATENVQYMSGYYRKPHDDDRTDPQSPYSYRNIDGGGYLSADASTMECVKLTADMLCMFYYAKTVEFSELQEGVAVDVPIRMPWGEERTMQIIYQGTTEFQGRTAYSLITNFTYDGVLSSYPITTLIDTERRVPLEFAADIAIGSVEMIYQF